MKEGQNRIRIIQTYQSYTYLRDLITRWFSSRKKADPLFQYVSQLKALSQKLDQELEKLSVQVNGISPTQNRGDVYRTCIAYDQYLLWVQRIWEYYRFRFDQRDDPELHDVLAAADEIVWSCFHAIFPDPLPGAPNEAPYRPAPLPYIAPDYSPQSLDRPSAEIQAAADMPVEFQQKLDSYLKRLPIPTVSLPPACVQFPWWLVFLGHEVGHQVQREADAIQSFSVLLSTAAVSKLDAGLDKDEFSARWAAWGSEIFADVFSVMMLGPSAYWAMIELDAGDEFTMLSPRRGRYPAPVVRLSLMRTLLQKLELNPDEYASLDQSDLDLPVDKPPFNNQMAKLQQDAKLDRSLLPAVVEAIKSQPVQPLGLLTKTCEWNAAQFRPGGAVRGWAKLLRSNDSIEPEYTLEAAREIISGAVVAWAQTTSIKDETEREDAEKLLIRNMLPTIMKSREPKTRAATIPSPRAQPLPGDDLADILVANLPVA